MTKLFLSIGAAVLALSTTVAVAQNKAYVASQRSVAQSPYNTFAYAPRAAYVPRDVYTYGPRPMPGEAQQTWYEFNLENRLSAPGQ